MVVVVAVVVVVVGVVVVVVVVIVVVVVAVVAVVLLVVVDCNLSISLHDHVSYYWRYQVSSADLDRFIYEIRKPEESETDNKYG